MKVRSHTIEELNSFAKRDFVTGCLEWQYSLIDGYGQIKDGGTMVAAHRYSYQLQKGVIPEGLLVCHTCDNRKCIAIEHLFLGTHQDNSDDMVQKGRGNNNSGIRNPNVKLTNEQVLLIRETKSKYPELKYSELAPIFGVTPEMISLICRRKYRNDV